MDLPKIKKFSENLHFFSNVLYIFQFLLILMPIFEKNYPNFRAFPNGKFSFQPRKIRHP